MSGVWGGAPSLVQSQSLGGRFGAKRISFAISHIKVLNMPKISRPVTLTCTCADGFMHPGFMQPFITLLPGPATSCSVHAVARH